jgi:hypothetical protein
MGLIRLIPGRYLQEGGALIDLVIWLLGEAEGGFFDKRGRVSDRGDWRAHIRFKDAGGRFLVKERVRFGHGLDVLNLVSILKILILKCLLND